MTGRARGGVQEAWLTRCAGLARVPLGMYVGMYVGMCVGVSGDVERRWWWSRWRARWVPGRRARGRAGGRAAWGWASGSPAVRPKVHGLILPVLLVVGVAEVRVHVWAVHEAVVGHHVGRQVRMQLAGPPRVVRGCTTVIIEAIRHILFRLKTRPRVRMSFFVQIWPWGQQACQRTDERKRTEDCSETAEGGFGRVDR